MNNMTMQKHFSPTKLPPPRGSIQAGQIGRANHDCECLLNQVPQPLQAIPGQVLVIVGLLPLQVGEQAWIAGLALSLHSRINCGCTVFICCSGEKTPPSS